MGEGGGWGGGGGTNLGSDAKGCTLPWREPPEKRLGGGPQERESVWD